MVDLLTGYDMVVALKEDTINAELLRLYQTPLTADPNSDTVIHQILDTTTTNHGFTTGIKAQIGAPFITLRIEDSRPNYLRFTVPLLSGTYYYIDLTQNEPQQHVDTKGWQIYFPINVKKIPYNAADIDAARAGTSTKQMLKSFSSEIFTINCLALDFEDANNLVENISITTAGASLQDDTVAQAVIGLKNHFSHLAGTSNPFVLGYAITRAASPEAQAVLEPTSVDYSTTPYIYPQGTAAKDQTHDGRGTFNLLLMTANKSAPIGSNAGTFQTNWVDSDDKQGAMIISNTLWKSRFIEGMILPDLFSMLASLSGPLAVKNGRFVPTDDHTWQLNYQYQNTNTYENADSGVRDLIETNTYTNTCTVSLVAGPFPLIKIAGSFQCNESFKEKEHISGADVDGAWAWATTRLDWDSYLTFAAGQDGKIIVNVGPVGSYAAPQTSDKGWYYKATDWFADLLGKGMDNTLQEVQTASSAIVNYAFGNIVSGISAAFTPLNNTFVFPGGSTFFFSNLRMNAEEDILVDVTYNDNPAIGSTQQIGQQSQPSHPMHW